MGLITMSQSCINDIARADSRGIANSALNDFYNPPTYCLIDLAAEVRVMDHAGGGAVDDSN